jgi:glycosyltransferase 2 family protein
MDQKLNRITEGIRRKRLVLMAKLFVTLALCGLIIWKADWPTIWETGRQADPALVLAVFLSMILNVSISAYKWQVLLRLHGENFRFARLRNYYFIAVFFNNFLPSSIGGDAYRVYKTYQTAVSKAAAILAVVSERLTGIIALVILGFFGGVVVWFQSQTRQHEVEMVLAIFGAVMTGSILMLLFSKPIAARFATHPKFPQKIKILLQHLGDYRRHPRETYLVVFVSFLFHVFTFFWMMMLIWAVGGQLDIFKLMLAVAVSNLVAVLPFSINGIGLMDGSFIYVVSRLGMDFNLALMVMLFIRTLLIALSLIGGLYYFSERKSLDLDKIRKQPAGNIPTK